MGSCPLCRSIPQSCGVSLRLSWGHIQPQNLTLAAGSISPALGQQLCSLLTLLQRAQKHQVPPVPVCPQGGDTDLSGQRAGSIPALGI